ncbi:dihydrofolate synthase/folylpolyglutamate synthase [Erythromicrobium ramosum]|uniref:tetrahydrofolate synthase n=1 Tax=Erythrobacter ramosus TaxID=35811 RepID=A0A6I4UNN5_9SPHN|nr:folylpolyglutamate synthase/dihydrofolate synthase family protein [Erythrobacter ramosus]MBB3775768.1 dihydrofolate synthase/folylpolyglutamate synthase [Erythrobacter ramosus]MXP39139.1 bifunctional folylpolyglutamate synthase/dihydrofolate synthase [Erythrobacter ramosus]
MKPLDFGRSDDPRVQAQLDRLSALSVPQGRLGLETIRALLDRLGNPHRQLPPVFHVAGTNGKGSTCAFLRAMLEAEGYRVHVTTSPHLVRYNERIRLAGELISDAALAEVLAEVLNAGEDLAPSFFEVTIAAAFLAFSRTPADVCVVEVGMGGRFDATNVLEPEALAACGIAALGLDHERFLLAPEDGVPLEPMARIAFEKAGIAKQGVPLVTLSYRPESNREVIAAAQRAGAPLAMCGDAWDVRPGVMTTYHDQVGTFTFPRPALAGVHQVQNAGLALAMIQHQDRVTVDPLAMAKGLLNAHWPARMQRLKAGPLTGTREVWLDGGHNPQAGAMLGEHFAGQRLHLVIGMIEGKDPTAVTVPLGPTLVSITAVPVPGHDWHPVEAFGPKARPAPDVASAMAMIPDDGLPILIAGSLYLAGEVLRLNHELPD